MNILSQLPKYFGVLYSKTGAFRGENKLISFKLLFWIIILYYSYSINFDITIYQ